MSVYDKVAGYVEQLILMKTGLVQESVQQLLHNQLVQQIIQQQRQLVYFDVGNMQVYEQLPHKTYNSENPELFVLTATERPIKNDISNRILSQVFQLFEVSNLQTSLYNIISPINRSLEYNQPTPDQQELQQIIQRFADSLKDLSEQNILNDIPYIQNGVTIAHDGASKEDIVGQIKIIVEKVSQFNSLKLPLFNVTVTTFDDNLLENTELISRIMAQSASIIRFYYRYFKRLNTCVQQVQTILSDEETLESLKTLSVEYQKNNDTSFNMSLAQYEHLKNNFRCQLADNNKDLFEQLKHVYNHDFSRLDVDKLKELISSYQYGDIAQMQLIYAAIYLQFSEYILSRIKADIIDGFRSNQIRQGQITAEEVKMLVQQIKQRDSDKDEQCLPITSPNIFHMQLFIGNATRGLFRVFQSFEDKVLGQQKLNFDTSYGLYQLVNQICNTYNSYVSIISDVKQIQDNKCYEKYIEMGLQKVQYEMDWGVFRQILDDNGESLIRTSLQERDTFAVMPQSVQRHADQYNQLLCNSIMNVKKVFFADQNGRVYNQLRHNQARFVELERTEHFGRHIRQFDTQINHFIDNLQPKYYELHYILQQFGKIHRLEELSRSRSEIASKYAKIVAQLTGQLTNILQKVLYERESRPRARRGEGWFDFYGQLTDEQRAVLDNCADPLAVFRVNSRNPVRFGLVADEQLGRLRAMQRQTGSAELGGLIERVARYGCTVAATVDASSFCGEALKSRMNVLYDRPLLQRRGGRLACNRPYQLRQIEEDYAVLKARLFDGLAGCAVSRPYSHERLGALLCGVECRLAPGVGVVDFVMRDMERLWHDGAVGSPALAALLSALFCKDIAGCLDGLADLPQYFYTVSDAKVLVMSLRDVLENNNHVQSFYGFLYDPNLSKVQTYVINGTEMDVLKFNIYYERQCQAVQASANQLFQKYNEFKGYLRTIDQCCKLLKYNSQESIGQGVQAISYNLRQLLDLFSCDLATKKRVFDGVQTYVFKILLNKTIIFMDQLLRQLRRNNMDSDAGGQNSRYSDIVEPYLQQQDAELMMNVIQCFKEYLQNNQEYLHVSIKLNNGRVVFQPTLEHMSSYLLGISAEVCNMFMGQTYGGIDGQVGTHYAIFQEQHTDKEVSAMIQVYEYLYEQCDRYGLVTVNNCYRFGEMYENRAILFSQQSYELLASKIGEDIGQWIHQFDLLSQNDCQCSKQQYGVVTIQYDLEFQQQSQQSINKLRKAVGVSLQKLAADQLQGIIAVQEGQQQHIQQFSRLQIEGLLQSSSLNKNVFQLLQTVDSCAQFRRQYSESRDELRQARRCTKDKEIEQQFAKTEAYDASIGEWLEQTAQLIRDSRDFENLVTHLQLHDQDIYQRANQCVTQWQDFLLGLDAAKQCLFDKAQEQLAQRGQEIKEIQAQIEQLAPAIQVLEGINSTINMPEFKSHNLIKPLMSVYSDCEFHRDSVCGSLISVQQSFQRQCNQNIYQYSQEDIVQIVKHVQEELQRAGRDVSQSQFYQYLAHYFRMVSRLSMVVSQICNTQVFKRQHWKQLGQRIDKRLASDNLQLMQVFGIYLQGIDSADSIQFKQRVKITEDVLQIANGQFIIEKYIKEVESYWQDAKFTIYNDGINTMISKWGDYNQQIEEHSSGLTGLSSSPYYAEYQKQAEEWKEKLNKLAEIFDVWADTQRRWIYLQSIFSSNQNIVNVYLSEVCDKLKFANRSYDQVIQGVIEDPVITRVLNSDQFQDRLEQIRDSLEEVQKALGSFLEKQRGRSPRLFFVGDEDLLDIISTVSRKSLQGLQKHWKKLFVGVDRVVVQEAGDELGNIVGVVSKQGEEIIFDAASQGDVDADELAIHRLIRLVERGMTDGVKRGVFSAIGKIMCAGRDNTGMTAELIGRVPAQCIVLAHQIVWTSQIEALLDNQVGFGELVNHYADILKALSVLQLTPRLEPCRNILISELTHIRNTTQMLAKSTNLRSDMGLQLRYHASYQNCTTIAQIAASKVFEPKNFAICCLIGDAELEYAFEYHGTDQRIVQTELTDFCYLVGTQAMADKLACAPQGRAGTGKTESTKALAIQLGRPVLVFNTDENFNEAAVGRILVGACEVGALVCFDEFNRLEENTLSAVSQQLAQIQHGLKEGMAQIANFLPGSEKQYINIHQNTAIFITMNPGYAGRRELPDTLKALLRDVAMNHPDLVQITEVMLSSNGFVFSQMLAQKIVPFFQLAGEQMTSQPHYDWGLRAIKAVLNSAGAVLKQLSSSGTDDARRELESRAIVSAIIDAVVPKIIQADVAIFESLLLDIFPGADLSPVRDELFMEQVISVIKSRNLVQNDQFVAKVMQIFRSQQVNIGVMLVGPTGTGKSTALHVFLEAIDMYYQTIAQRQESAEDQNHAQSYVRYDILCPKSFSGKEDLFGSLDQTTREWQDGQFSSMLRLYLNEIAEQHVQNKQYYAIFDSYIDPEWVESLNSVLDDNRCLTLPNGERLAVPSNIHLFFEVKDLKDATPATVSRCSMIWFAKEILPIQTRFEGFVRGIEAKKTSHTTLKQQLLYAADQYAAQSWRVFSQQVSGQECWLFITQLLLQLEQRDVIHHEVMVFNDQRLLTTIISILEASLAEVHNFVEQAYTQTVQRLGTQPQKDEENVEQLLKAAGLDTQCLRLFFRRRLVLATCWGFCSAQSNKERFTISQIIYDYFKTTLNDNTLSGLAVDYSDVRNGSNTLLQYNSWIDGGAEWVHNGLRVRKTDIPEGSVGNVIVETIDTVTQGFMIGSWLQSGRPLVLVGPAGSGKSMSLTAAISQLHNCELVFTSFSSSTGPEQLRALLLRSCERVHTGHGVVLRPRGRVQTLVILCDEINLPVPDNFGCQRVIEFIRTIIETRTFYDPHTRTQYNVQGISFAATCNPPTDPGRHHLCERFLAHCPVLLCDFPTRSSLCMIYTTFTRAILSTHAPSMAAYADAAAATMVDVYARVSVGLTIEQQQHYIYSPRELTRWVRGLRTGLANQKDIKVGDIATLLYHEGLRLFMDRLVYNSEKSWFLNQIDQAFAANFHPASNSWNSRGNFPILYSFLNQDGLYELTTLSNIRHVIEMKENSYFEEQRLTNPLSKRIILSDEVIETILKIDRVIKQPVGHLLLIGMSGVGKSLISRFVSWINDYEVYEISTHRKYTLHDFEELLRKLITRAGVKDIRISFLFDESNALETTFLEHMNALLASGEVPGLFDGENMTQLLMQAREQIQKLRQDESYGKQLPEASAKDDEVLGWVTRRVQANLHIIFSMNMPGQSKLQQGLQSTASSSPALFNRCVIVWMGNWNYGSFLQISQALLNELEFSTGNSEEGRLWPDVSTMIRQFSSPDTTYDNFHAKMVEDVHKYNISWKVIGVLCVVHKQMQQLAERVEISRPQSVPDQILDSAPQKLATPRHFVRAIQLLQNQWDRALRSQNELFSHVSKGLLVLKETQNEVAAMQRELNEKTTLLSQAKQIADGKLSEIVVKKQEAQEKQVRTNALLREITAKQAEIRDKRGPIERELQEVQPAIDKAKKAITGIDKKKLDEMKAMAKPPEQIMLAMQAVVLVVGDDADRRDLSWDGVKRVMRKPDFLRSMIEYNADSAVLPPQVLRRLQERYINSSGITVESVMRASAAAGPMYQWVISVQKYQDIVKKVEPLTKEIEQIESEAARLQTQYEAANSEVQTLNEQVSQYEQEYKDMLKKQQELDQQRQLTEEKLARASTLVNSLNLEAERWETQCEEFSQKIKNSVGDQILLAVYQVYGLVFPEDLRKDVLELIKHVLDQFAITFTDQLIIEERLFEDMGEKTRWINECGLSNDQVTIQNMASLLSLSFHDQQAGQYKYYISSPGLLLNISSIGQFKQTLSKIFGKNVIFTSSIANDLQQSAERAIKFGQILIVENCEDYDPLLNECIDFASQVGGYAGYLGNRKIVLGGKEIEASPNFRLILIMNSSRGQKVLPPSVISKCLTLNFATTQLSYATKLQQMILEYERPSVGQERRKLLADERVFSARLIDLEKQLLSIISQTDSKQILEDDGVSKVLHKAKQEAIEVQSKRAQSLELCEKLEQSSTLYMHVAAYISALFFSINKLHKIHYSALFTIEFFQYILDETIKQICVVEDEVANLPENTLQRMQLLAQSLTKDVYTYVGCSLPEVERQAFALHIISLIHSRHDYQVAMGFSSMESAFSQLDKDLMFKGFDVTLQKKMGTVQESYQTICENSGPYAGINEQLIELMQYWGSERAEKPAIDQNIVSLENAAQSLSLSACLQPLVIPEIIQYVFNTLVVKDSYQLPIQLQFADLVEKFKDHRKPFLITVVGPSDPNQVALQISHERQVLQFAVGQKNCNIGTIKQQLAVVKKNTLLIISNIHLAPVKFTEALLKILQDELQRTDLLTVVLTTNLSQLVPTNTYSGCVKYSIETSLSISVQCKKTFLDMLQCLNAKGIKNKSITRLCYLVSVLHSVITIRGKFAPHGFIRDYNYTASDIEQALRLILKKLGDKARQSVVSVEDIPFLELRRYVQGLCYGNKAVFPHDRAIAGKVIDLLLSRESYVGGAQIQELHGLELAALQADAQQIADHIAQLPDDVRYLGLQPVVQKLFYQQQLGRMLDCAGQLETDSGQAGDGGGSDDGKMAHLIAQWCRDYALLDGEGAAEPPPARAADNVVNQLAEELKISERIVRVLAQDLKETLRYLSKEAPRTNKIAAILQQLRVGAIPAEWKDFVPTQMDKVVRFLEDTRQRRIYLKALFQQVADGSPLQEIDLGMLYQPTALLTSLKQVFARKMGVALDQLNIKYALERKHGVQHFISLKNISIMFARCQDGIVECANELFSQISEVVVNYSSLPIDGGELEASIPVYVDMSRQQEVFALSTLCRDVNAAMVQAVCCVLVSK